ncbi:MAG: polyprenyl synthetase family protein, partial [Thermoleophilia bacterium]|nr:polyprenyl synthetase family protein [Thermoleophilia bacterium]
MARSAIPEPVTAVTDLAGAWLPLRLEQVERRLAEIAAGHGEPIAADAGSTLAAGGKRMRPLLVLLCAGREAGEEAIRAATAIELVHMATLVHDDVLDDAPMRRGRPTVVANAGRARALATGDLLFSRAFAELAAPGSAAQVAALATASVALARGELAQRQDAYRADISAERYYLRCRLKTAALFECACVVGAERPEP